jgi:hypothetical protein
MDDLVVLEHQVAAVEIDVALLRLVLRHDMVEVGDLGGRHGRLFSLIYFNAIPSPL